VSQRLVDAADNKKQVWRLDVEVLLASPPGGDSGTVYAEVDLGNGERVTASGQATLPSETDLVARPDGAREFSARLKLDVPADKVELWWPTGYGKQPLYNLTVGFQPKGDDCGGKAEGAAALLRDGPVLPSADASAAESSTDPPVRAAAIAKLPYPVGGGASTCTAARRRIGFRTVELVEIPAKQAAAGDLRASWTADLDKYMWPSHYRPKEDWATIDGQWQYLGDPPVFWGPMYPTFGGYNFTYPSIGMTTPPMVADPSAPGGKRRATIDDGDGESFYFRVNGIPVYSKGSNLIPFSMFATNDTAAVVSRTLDMAQATHQNTIRIWGGGFYLSDYFHDQLDERGLLGWPETPFACNIYPISMEGFSTNIREEVRQQVRRITSHPSIMLWGGGNENEASLEWYSNTRANAPLYVSEYSALFGPSGLIAGVMQELAPSHPYLDSSPSSGYAQRPDPAKGVAGVKRWAQSQDPRCVVGFGFGSVFLFLRARVRSRPPPQKKPPLRTQVRRSAHLHLQQRLRGLALVPQQQIHQRARLAIDAHDRHVCRGY
jgi:hypothetical protein